MAKDFDLAHAGRLSLFETIIRIVGGLIAAFDASGDQMFLQKALELAQKLQVNFPKGGKGTGHRDMVLSSQPISLLAIWHPVCLSYKARTRDGSDRTPLNAPGNHIFLQKVLELAQKLQVRFSRGGR